MATKIGKKDKYGEYVPDTQVLDNQSRAKALGIDIPGLSALTQEPTAGQAYGGYSGSEYDTALNDAIKTFREPKPVDENKIRRDVLAQFQGEIDATNKVYAQKLAEAKQAGLGTLGSGRAIQARSGLLGSDFGAAQTSNIEGQNRGIQNSILNENAVAISSILGNARKEAAQEIADKRLAQQQGLDKYLGYLSSKTERTNTRLGNLALSFVQRGIDPTTLGEAEMNDLQKSYGVSKDDILGAYETATAPTAKGTPTASIQEYEYAKQNGYTGSYVDYQNEDANRKAKATGGGTGGLTPSQINTTVNSIANALDNEPVVKAYNTVQEGYQTIKSIGTNTKSPADDIAFIYAFAKIMDPNSVVREGEYNTIQKYAQTWADNFGFTAKRVFSNTNFLTADAKQKMLNALDPKVKTITSQYKNIYKEYQRQIDDAYAGKPRQITNYAGGTTEVLTTDSYTLPNGTVVTLQPDGTYQ